MLIVLLVSPNTIKEMNRRNKYLTLSHIVEKCVQPKLYTLLRIRKRQNERILIFIPPLKVGDFITRNKARNAFLTQGFLPSGATKLVQYKKICKCMWANVGKWSEGHYQSSLSSFFIGLKLFVSIVKNLLSNALCHSVNSLKNNSPPHISWMVGALLSMT